MCLLAFCFRPTAAAPLIVGANREEAYARPGEPPQLLAGPVRAVGGRDPVAGGTWLGVNAQGVLIAVTNRHKTELPAEPRSRGLLARELLTSATVASAVDRAVRELASQRYAGCNLLCGSAAGLVVVHGGDALEVRALAAGWHFLANRDVDDANDARLTRARHWLHQREPYATAEEIVAALKTLCGLGGENAICWRGAERGTVSSSLLVLRAPVQEGIYLHAQGPPDRTPYGDYSHLLQELG